MNKNISYIYHHRILPRVGATTASTSSPSTGGGPSWIWFFSLAFSSPPDDGLFALPLSCSESSRPNGPSYIVIHSAIYPRATLRAIDLISTPSILAGPIHPTNHTNISTASFGMSHSTMYR